MSELLPLKDRKAVLAKVPWITRLKKPHACDGFMSRTALKYLFGTDEQRTQRPRCKNLAYWKYTHSKRCDFHNGETEYYCWSHLYSRGYYGCMYEERRLRAWWERLKSTNAT